MDVFTHNYDPIPLSWSPESAESSSASDGVSSGRSNFANEEVMLASSHPKKCAGRKEFNETRHPPVYRGIRKRNGGKRVCELREPNKKSRIWLGTFPNAEMAARAHDVAAIALRGKLACLNFADSVWRLPVPATATTKDIQKAAAEIFRPSESEGFGESSENVFYMDKEAVFGMPGLLVNMAEGLMVPPLIHCEGEWFGGNIGVEFSDDLCLWSYWI